MQCNILPQQCNAIKHLQLTNSTVCFARSISKQSAVNTQTMQALLLTAKQCNNAIKCLQQFQYKMVSFALASVDTQTIQTVVLTAKQYDPCENVCRAMLTTSNRNFGVDSQAFANFTNSTMESLRCASQI